MGVKNLIKCIQYYCPNAIKYTNIEKYKNTTLAIDAVLMIYKNILAIRKNNISIKNKDIDVTHIHSIILKLNGFKKYNINPIFVFDGQSPNIKEKALEKRIKQDVNDADFEECKELIRLYGYQIIIAKGEADKVLVELGYPIVSDDMDMLVFGGLTLIKGFSISKIMVEISLKEILKTMDITQKQLIDIALILGTDYEFINIYGIGPINAPIIIKKYNNLQNYMKKEHIKYDIKQYEKVQSYFLLKNNSYTNIPVIKYNKNKIIKYLSKFNYEKKYFKKYLI